MSALVFSHMLCLTLSRNTPFHPILFLSLSPSHYSFPLPLYKPPPPSISFRLSLSYLHPPERPQSNKEIWSRFLYRIYQTCPEKHMCTLYYKYAFCTQDSFQETDASECIKDWSHSLYRKQKMINKNTSKHRKIRHSHNNTCFGCQLLFLSTKVQAYELLQSFPPSLLPSPPRDHPVCLGTRAPLHWVEMEGTYECVSVCLRMQDNEWEEREEEKKRKGDAHGHCTENTRM